MLSRISSAVCILLGMVLSVFVRYISCTRRHRRTRFQKFLCTLRNVALGHLSHVGRRIYRGALQEQVPGRTAGARAGGPDGQDLREHRNGPVQPGAPPRHPGRRQHAQHARGRHGPADRPAALPAQHGPARRQGTHPGQHPGGRGRPADRHAGAAARQERRRRARQAPAGPAGARPWPVGPGAPRAPVAARRIVSAAAAGLSPGQRHARRAGGPDQPRRRGQLLPGHAGDPQLRGRAADLRRPAAGQHQCGHGRAGDRRAADTAVPAMAAAQRIRLLHRRGHARFP